MRRGGWQDLLLSLWRDGGRERQDRAEVILPVGLKSEGLLKTRGIAWLGALTAKRVGAWDFSPKLPSDFGSHGW